MTQRGWGAGQACCRAVPPFPSVPLPPCSMVPQPRTAVPQVAGMQPLILQAQDASGGRAAGGCGEVGHLHQVLRAVRACSEGGPGKTEGISVVDKRRRAGACRVAGNSQEPPLSRTCGLLLLRSRWRSALPCTPCHCATAGAPAAAAHHLRSHLARSCWGAWLSCTLCCCLLLSHRHLRAHLARSCWWPPWRAA